MRDSNQPLVSVIIPCYNYGQYILETIESVKRQTYRNIEIVIADDGSDYFTLEVLRALEKEDSIKILYLDRKGPSAARNEAINCSNGEFILPLDADDKIGETYIEKAVNLLCKDKNLGIVYCEAMFFGSINEKWNLPKYSFPEILLGNRIFVSAIFRKSDWHLVGGFSSLYYDEWEDFDFWLKIIELNRQVFQIPEALFFYRKGHNSRSGKKSMELLPLFLRIFENHRDLYNSNMAYIFKELIERQDLIHNLQSRIDALDKDLSESQEIIRDMRKSMFFKLKFFLENPDLIPKKISQIIATFRSRIS